LTHILQVDILRKSERFKIVLFENWEISMVRLKGIIPPMLTPVNWDRDIDMVGLERLVGHLVQGGVDGIFLFGSSGEGPWLTQRQRDVVLKHTRQIVGPDVMLLVGVLDPGTAGVIESIRHFESSGAVDAFVVTTPYYFATTPADQIDHFSRIAESTELPIVLYNIPPMTHHTILPDTVAALLAHPNIIGIKDSGGDMQAFERMLNQKQHREGFSVLQGAEGMAADALIAGADGVVPGLGNLVPAQFKQLFEDVLRQDERTAHARQRALRTLGELHQQAYWLKCLKYAASLQGFGSACTLAHRDDLTAKAKERIRDHLQQFADGIDSMSHPDV